MFRLHLIKLNSTDVNRFYKDVERILKGESSMAISVNTNLAALTAQSALSKSTSTMTTAMERMSTGSRINSAKDDAAGLSIASTFNTQIRGSKVASSNIQQGQNLLQTADGALSSMEDNLNRIRDLAVQAANGTNSSTSRSAIESEAAARIAEINDTANNAKFNGVDLLSSTAATSVTLQVGANSGDTLTLANVFGDAQASTLGLTTDAATAFADATSSNSFLTEIDSALKEVASRRADIGAYQNRLDSKSDNLNVTIENFTASKGTIMDADVAEEASSYINAQILQQTSASLLSTANQSPSIALSLI